MTSEYIVDSEKTVCDECGTKAPLKLFIHIENFRHFQNSLHTGGSLDSLVDLPPGKNLCFWCSDGRTDIKPATVTFHHE